MYFVYTNTYIRISLVVYELLSYNFIDFISNLHANYLNVVILEKVNVYIFVLACINSHRSIVLHTHTYIYN